jgi:hypothetical protein
MAVESEEWRVGSEEWGVGVKARQMEPLQTPKSKLLPTPNP